jgi:hypothetical protein
MKYLLLIALLTSSLTALAGGKTCKAYLSDSIGYEEKEAGINYYDYVDLLASHGYEATTAKDEADIHLSLGVGYIQRCYDGSASNFAISVDEFLSADAMVWVSYKNTVTGKRIHLDKYIYKNITRKKTLRKLNKLLGKLPKCK